MTEENDKSSNFENQKKITQIDEAMKADDPRIAYNKNDSDAERQDTIPLIESMGAPDIPAPPVGTDDVTISMEPPDILAPPIGTDDVTISMEPPEVPASLQKTPDVIKAMDSPDPPAPRPSDSDTSSSDDLADSSSETVDE